MKSSRLLLLLLAGVTFLGACSPAAAQVVVRWYRPGGYYWDYGPFSSTPLEGTARGLAEVIRARGEAARQRSEAILNYQQARSRYIENQRKWLDAYLARRRAGEAAREEERAERRQARERYLEWKHSQPNPSLSPSQFDPATGYINWPEALRAPEFAGTRREIEELLLLQAQTGSVDNVAGKLYEQTRRLEDELKAQIRELPPHQYIAARNFLDALAYEARALAG